MFGHSLTILDGYVGVIASFLTYYYYVYLVVYYINVHPGSSLFAFTFFPSHLVSSVVYTQSLELYLVHRILCLGPCPFTT